MKTKNTQLYRSIVIYGVIGVFVTSLLVAAVTIVPLSLRLKGSSEDRIAIAASSKASAVDALLTGFSNVADQIASRSAIRDELSAYTQGKITQDELISFNRPKLNDALLQDSSLAGVEQFDSQGNLVVQIGLSVPNEVVSLLKLHTPDPSATLVQSITIQGEPYLMTTRLILDADKIQVGSDLILFKTGELREIVDDVHMLGKSAVVVLGRVEENGFAPLFASRPLTGQEGAFHNQAVRYLMTQDKTLYDPNSMSMMISSAQVETSDWFITVQMSKEDLYAEVRAQVYRVAALVILLTLLGTGGMVILLKPLAQGMLIHEEELKNMLLETAEHYQAEYEERLAIEQDLRLLSSRYESVVQTARDAIILADFTGKIVDWNSAAEAILGYTSSEMIGQSISTLMPDRLLKTHQSAFETFIKDEATFQRRSRSQTVARRKDGSQFPADISLSLFEMDGKKYIAAILRDMSELRSVEEALKQSQERYQSMIEDVVDASLVAIAITDAQFNIVWENQAAIRLWNLDRSEAIGKDKRWLLDHYLVGQIEDGEQFVQQVLNSYGTGKHLENVEIHFPARDGKNERWVMYSSNPIRVGFYAGGRIEQYVDITEQKELQSRIERLAVTDELTGVYNRRGLYEFGKRDLARAYRVGTPLCALFLDIDRFKSFNDQYGHTLGDLVLKELSFRIKHQIREMDLFARFGGEEFVVLLPDTPLDQASQMAERIRTVIADTPFDLELDEVSVTISIGITQFRPEDDLTSLLERADRGMYQAKNNGRNRLEWITS